MPIYKVKNGWKCGKTGKIHPTKKDAEKQCKAIQASKQKKKKK